MKRVGAWCFCSGGVRRIGVNNSVVAFGPFLPARMVHEVFRTARQEATHSQCRSRRARGRRTPRGVRTCRSRPRSKHADAAELRVVAAAVLAVAADAVLGAHHLPKLGAHLVTALARLHAHTLARRSSSEAGSTREKKRGKERRSPCGSFARETGNTGGARACIPNGDMK